MADSYTCHARGCQERISGFKLMCHRHWVLVPGWVKRKLAAFRESGKVVADQGNREYLRALAEAIKWVDKLEKKKGS